MDFFYKQNFKKIEKNKNFQFWKFSGMSTLKWGREVSFEYFWVRFSGIDRETCQEAYCAIKWIFFSTYAWIPQITLHLEKSWTDFKVIKKRFWKKGKIFNVFSINFCIIFKKMWKKIYAVLESFYTSS